MNQSIDKNECHAAWNLPIVLGIDLFGVVDGTGGSDKARGGGGWGCGMHVSSRRALRLPMAIV